MHRSYRLGLIIVVGTVLASLGLCLAAVSIRPKDQRAGHDLGENAYLLGPFRLTERSGKAVTEADLADRVWITSFIFTHCPLSCPRITSVMKGLQEKLKDSSALLVSISVDPERDTPEVLSAYAKKFSADPDRWWFLTGSKPEIDALIVDKFKLALSTSSPDQQAAGAEAFSHSDRLALVGRDNKVIGYFDSNDPEAVTKLVERAKQLAPGTQDVPAWVRQLPAVNATLNGIASILLLVGWFLIRTGRARGHQVCMIASVVVSGLFLSCYLVYHFQIRGGVPFLGRGPVRLVYFTILLSHVVLAVVIVPLILVTLLRAIRKQWHYHASIARVTFPVWMYVSVTGVVIYLMLYQMPLASG